MGSWGVGIFSNDTGADLRDDFRDLIAQGLSAQQATDQLRDDYGIGQGEEDDNDFWLCLAAVQHRVGHVADGVIERALAIIADPVELERWAPADRKRRQAALGKLQSQLTQPVPTPRKLKPRKKVDTALVPGEHVIFETESGPVLLRITSVTSDKGGRYPRAVEVQWDGTEMQALRAHRLPPVVLPAEAVGGEPFTRGYTLIGEPLDPPGLRRLPSTVDGRTPPPRNTRSYILRWSQIPKHIAGE